MLKTHSLFFAYNKSVYFKFPDIDLGDGEDLLILGESGIGKTTFLHLMAGLLKPGLGRVEIMGTSITELKTSVLDRFRGENIGLVFQHPQFIQALTVKENLALIQYLAVKRPDYDRIGEVLKALGLFQKIDERPKHLSQGERQRLGIAMAVVNAPKIILADEPTASLDDKNCERVVRLLKEQALVNKAQLVVITHDNRLKSHFNNTLQL